MSVSEAVRTAQVVQMLLPDEQQAHVYKAEVEENLREGQMLLFHMDLTFTSAKLIRQVT